MISSHKINLLFRTMPPPNQLSIATSSLNRLVKEEASYHHEHEQQRARIAKLEAADGEAEAEGEEGNREFEVKQQVSPFLCSLSPINCWGAELVVFAEDSIVSVLFVELISRRII